MSSHYIDSICSNEQITALTYRESRDVEDIEEIENLLESYYMQVGVA